MVRSCSVNTFQSRKKGYPRNMNLDTLGHDSFASRVMNVVSNFQRFFHRSNHTPYQNTKTQFSFASAANVVQFIGLLKFQ